MGKLSRLLICLVCLSAGAASADKASDEAKTRFKRGADFYDEGNYRAALIEFERAHQLLPNYKILYNIAQVRMQLLDYARAQETFARYLKEGGSDVNGSRREEVKTELEKLRSRVGRIAISTAEGAEVLLDDESIGTAPLQGPVAANAGRHTVTVVVPGRSPQSRVVDVAGLETSNVTLGQIAPVADSRSSASPASSSRPFELTKPVVKREPSKAPMIASWVATGVLAATSGILAGLSFGAQGDLQKLKGTLGVTQASLNAGSARVGTLAAAADILGLAALVGGGISLWLTISALSTDDSSVAIGPTGMTFFTRF